MTLLSKAPHVLMLHTLSASYLCLIASGDKLEKLGTFAEYVTDNYEPTGDVEAQVNHVVDAFTSAVVPGQKVPLTDDLAVLTLAVLLLNKGNGLTFTDATKLSALADIIRESFIPSNITPDQMVDYIVDLYIK
jgi:hypothetical protein